MNISLGTELYKYRSYFETLFTYGSGASATHLTNAFWYLEYGDLLPWDPTAADTKNEVFNTRWTKIRQRKEVHLYGRIHIDICNVPPYLIPAVRMQIKFTKAPPNFYMMGKDAETKTVFKFLYAQLLVTASDRVRHSCWHTISLSEMALAHVTI